MSTISSLTKSLNTLIENKVKHSVFIWGAPGIGKSSAVTQVAKDKDLELIDLRISQLAPTDIRGLPYTKDGRAYFAPPSFLPTSGEGILFLDELNMASPSVMGIAQQLILDRQVGDYKVPEGWFIVAAGNRTEDRAAISQMPAPVANRFIHFHIDSSLDSWKEYAIGAGINEKILAFLNFRPQLLYNFEKNQSAWPSPRSWEFANTLLNIDLSIESAVGSGAASEFYAYQTIYTELPNVDLIFDGEDIPVPHEPSLIYAVCGALINRAKTADNVFKGLKWLMRGTTEDYVGLYMSDAMIALKAKNLQGAFIKIVSKDSDTKDFMKKYQELLR
ncbi:MoxR-like ATPase [Cyanophage S-TIM5]|uniref:MoxR-like ATPase n=1 Tax=Cyanophage S-TIM5 TaxID=1137745 RepID=H6WG28_9CAUD|nr:ATPase [Cyanophage S-TIM5]AEZ65751.1 MoxR-like ATPase [Cyanophage S-TIM5]